MAPEGELKKRVARKLTKKRKEGYQVTMEIPERFKDGDDADEDCTAVHGGNPLMNQSVFGMIAAAGSQVDFNARFDAQSSDEEDESVDPSSQSSELQVDKTRQGKSEKESAQPEKHKRKFSENKILRSLPRLGAKAKSNSKSPRRPSSPVPGSPSEPPAKEVSRSRALSNHAPVMSRMLEARAELSMRPSFDLPRHTLGASDGEDEGGKGSSSLAKRLMEIFGFETPEDVIEGVSSVTFTKPNTNSDRIPLLATEECITSRLHVHYDQAHLFLCIFTEEICKLDLFESTGLY